MTTSVLISGAGIAGPALALWLSRHGLRATVVERAPALRTGGYKIDVRGAATEVLRRAGLLGEVQAAATDVRRLTFLGASGRPVAALDAGWAMASDGDDAE